MMKCFVLCLQLLWLLPSVLLAASVDPAVSAWTSGSFSLAMHQVDQKTVEVTLHLDVADVVAAVVHVPGGKEDLVRITVEGTKEFLREALSPRKAIASMSLGLPSLEGDLSQRLPYDATKLRSVEVILVKSDGTVLPSTITADGLSEGTRVVLTFGPRGCYTVSGDCHCNSQGENCACSDSKTCCTFPPNPCLDCGGEQCEITCGPCEQPPPT